MSIESVTIKVEPMDISVLPDPPDIENSELQPHGEVQGASTPLEPVIPAYGTDPTLQDSEDRKNLLVSRVPTLNSRISLDYDGVMEEKVPANIRESPKPEFVSIKVEINEESDPYQSPSASGRSSPLMSPEHPDSPAQTEDCSNLGQSGEGERWAPVHVDIKQEPVGDREIEDYMIPVDPSFLVTNADSSDESSESDIDTSKYIRNKDVRTIMSKVTDNFECPVCKMNISTKSNLTRHLMRHIKHKIICHECKRQFLCKAMLKQHIRDTHAEKVFNCDQCPLTFKFSVELLRHKQQSHVRYTCNHCGKQYSDQRLYRKHAGRKSCKKHLNLPCGVCGKVFKREYMYKLHMRTHSQERPYQCDLCQLKFKDKSALTRHIQLHDGNKPYSCKICGKRFATAGLIKPHMRVHTGDRPYVCTICDRAFSHKHNMTRHFESHEKKKTKQLVCEICLKVFPRESRLMYHMRIHMENNRPFKCDHCTKSFSNRQNIVRHYRRKHPDKTYTSCETDASVARELWRTIMARKMSDPGEVIVPDGDVDEAREGVGGAPPSPPELKPQIRDEDWILRIKT